MDDGADDLPNQYAPGDVETTVAEYWAAADAYEAAKEAHADDPDFFFVDVYGLERPGTRR
jgi:isoleucyl-tRNA synthetase